MGNTDATATMIKDHEEVVQLAEELESLSKELQREKRLDDELAVSLRRVLYGLYTIIGLHFAKEEELYAPLLERGLSPEEARLMFQKLEMLG
jgi:hemerythrin-like domain-containing protein